MLKAEKAKSCKHYVKAENANLIISGLNTKNIGKYGLFGKN